jgi:hypothetical protein
MITASEERPRRWMGTAAVVAWLTRTGDIEHIENNPYFPTARALLLNSLMVQKVEVV